MDKRLYIVTVRDRRDLEGLYQDLETAGGPDRIPQRQVECSLRRPLSRNTHYYLTDEEAALLRGDLRVKDVQLPPEELGIEFLRDAYSQTGDFDKSNQANSDSVNWAIYQNFLDAPNTSWGVDATAVETATVDWNLTGENVDILIVDDTVDGDHPDFAVNADGTGGSRFQALDWYTYNSQVTGLGDLDGQTLPTGSYKYFYLSDESHGTSVASCAAGSRHGMAKSANIYNIHAFRPSSAKIYGSTSGSVLTVDYVYPGSDSLKVGDRIEGPGIYGSRTISSFGTGTGGVGTYNLNSAVGADYSNRDFKASYPGDWSLLMMDYIRAWHRNKPVNTTTGKRNPTIANLSFGLYVRPVLSAIYSVTYRGTTYTSSTHSPWTLDELYSSFGIPKETSVNAVIPAGYAAFEADIQDAIDDGIFMVSAAGNNNCKMCLDGDADYDNSLSYYGTTYYYHRGDAITKNLNVLVAGSNNPKSTMQKSSFSNCGNRVDIFSPGENVAAATLFTPEIFTINRWEVSSNVVTFRIDLPESDILLDLSGKEVAIFMDSTSALDGVHVIQSVSYEPLQIYATLFTINLTYADTAQTAEGGIGIGYYTGRGNYPLDERGSYTYMEAVDGTSFSSPATTGLLACLMQVYRRMDINVAYGLIYDRAAYGLMTDSGSADYSDEFALRGAYNFVQGYEIDPDYQQFPDERPTTGLLYPKNNYMSRIDSFFRTHNMYYPRVSNYR